MSDLCHNCGNCHLPNPCEQPLFYCTLCSHYGHSYNFCPLGVHTVDPAYRFWMLCHSCDRWHLPSPCKHTLHMCKTCGNGGHLEIFCPVRPLSRLRPSTFDAQDVIDKAVGYKRQRTTSSSAEDTRIDTIAHANGQPRDVDTEKVRAIKIATAQQVFDLLNKGFDREQILAFVARPLAPTTPVPGAENGSPNTCLSQGQDDKGDQASHMQKESGNRFPQNANMQLTEQAQLALHNGEFGNVYDNMHSRFANGDLAQAQKDLNGQQGVDGTGESAHVANGPQGSFQAQVLLSEARTTGQPFTRPQLPVPVSLQHLVPSQRFFKEPQANHERQNMNEKHHVNTNSNVDNVQGTLRHYGEGVQAPSDQVHATPNSAIALIQQPVRFHTPPTGRGSGSKRCADCQRAHKRCIHIVEAGNTPHGFLTVGGQPAMPYTDTSDKNQPAQTNTQWVNDTMQTLMQMPGADPQDLGADTNNNPNPNLNGSLAALLHDGATRPAQASPVIEEGQKAQASGQAATTGPVQASQTPTQQTLTYETLQYEEATNADEQNQADELTSANNQLGPDTARSGVKPKKRGGGRRRK